MEAALCSALNSRTLDPCQNEAVFIVLIRAVAEHNLEPMADMREMPVCRLWFCKECVPR